MEFIDLGAQYRRIREPLHRRLCGVLEGGRYILGPEVSSLEERLAAFVGRRYAVCCSNGTDALILALLALGLRPGEGVVVPDFTFFATAEAVCAVGGVPVFADVRPDTMNLDPASAERAVLAARAAGIPVRGMIPVDLFGQPADYDALLPLCKRLGLFVVEDGAQGFGGALAGRRACSFGELSATSFFPAKPLGCYGDGGAVFTDDAALYHTLCSLRVHGSNPGDKYDNVLIGRNARLDALQAAVLHCKLDILEDELAAREQAAAWYSRRLAGLVQTPALLPAARSAYAQYTVCLPEGADRAAVIAALREQGVPAMVYYPRPLHRQTALARYGEGVCCPVTEDLCRRVLSLPMHPYLTEEMSAQVCRALEAAL